MLIDNPNHLLSESRGPSYPGQERVGKALLFTEQWYHLGYGPNYLAKERGKWQKGTTVWDRRVWDNILHYWASRGRRIRFQITEKWSIRVEERPEACVATKVRLKKKKVFQKEVVSYVKGSIEDNKVKALNPNRTIMVRNMGHLSL